MAPAPLRKIQREKAHSVIGGLFGLECGFPANDSAPPFLSGRDLFLVNARSGIWLLVNRLQPTQVWVPSYLCHAILGAIDPKITVLRFYEVDYDLRVVSNQWIADVASGDLVIFIDYFGFPYDRQLGACVADKGAWIVEDASQAMLSSHVGGLSEFVVFSLRKWIGVPDGGILRIPERFSFLDTSLRAPPPLWWLKALQATVLRKEFDDGIPTREWFNIFREVEDTEPTGDYVMSQLSQTILEHMVDYSLAAQRRVANYQALLEALSEFAIFREMDSGVVPLGFPVRVENRDSILRALFDQQIYPPVHWPIGGIVPPIYENSHRLAQQIMTIPCDQRYEPEDMKRIAEIFLRHANSEK